MSEASHVFFAELDVTGGVREAVETITLHEQSGVVHAASVQ